MQRNINRLESNDTSDNFFGEANATGGKEAGVIKMKMMRETRIIRGPTIAVIEAYTRFT